MGIKKVFPEPLRTRCAGSAAFGADKADEIDDHHSKQQAEKRAADQVARQLKDRRERIKFARGPTELNEGLDSSPDKSAAKNKRPGLRRSSVIYGVQYGL